ncbi:hypothetical protein HAP47_0023050 [Bradyrhizobium sp. 41S5]|uniref:hypothetical protein n=1 Tax=Bradyrhizobium sp. 41S5 TaxID=1404443 RepID=UPI00156ACA1F|nr:hypothetical protein [Bradyrhizobium sp. 41S5]UFX42141.1 hypothetical protein HAP47_0023050 [Bradyrhizobium sp. 41S5]
MFDSLLRFFRPSRSSPWDSAPPWALQLKHMQERILTKEDQIMAIEDDLDKSVSALASGYVSLNTAVQAELAFIRDAASKPTVDVARITQSIANIGNITSQMAVSAAALTASIPAATTVPTPPASTPVVDTPPDVTPPVIDTPAVTAPDATPPGGGSSA